MEGYIKLYRQIFENDIWNDKEPFDRRSAWIDLLLLANHKDHKIISKGKPVECKRGQVNRSISQLADRWHWSRGKTRRFIELLEKLKMCSSSSTTDGTTLTIEKYALYQGVRPASDTTDDTTDGTTDGQVPVQQTDTYNNDKKGKKGENDNLERDKREIEEKLLSHSRKEVPDVFKAQHEAWIQSIGGVN